MSVESELVVWCLKRALSPVRVTMYKNQLNRMRKILGKDPLGLSQEDVDNVYIAISTGELAGRTKISYWVMSKKIIKLFNPKVKVKLYNSKFGVRRKMPEEILSSIEIEMMISATETRRNRAVVSLLYESGCRPHEILGLRIKDVEFDEYGLVIRVDGKTGMRRVRIVKYADLVRSYVSFLPKRDNPNTKLFPFCDRNLEKMLNKLAVQINCHKNVYPYIFRHSRATHLAKLLTEAEMKEFFGWTADSKMVKTYVHLSGRDIDEKILKIHGININPENQGGIKCNHAQRKGLFSQLP